MDLSTLQTIIKGRLRNSKSPIVDGLILSELQVLQDNLEADIWLPWFLQDSTILTTSIGDHAVSFPTGFIREISDGGIWLLRDGKRVKQILKNDFDYLTTRYETTEGEPEAYAIMGGTFQIFPMPDAVYSLELFFFGKDTVIDGTVVTSNEWTTRASDLIIGEIGAIIAGQYTADDKAAQYFGGQATRGRARLVNAQIAWEEANRIRVTNP